MMDSNQVVQLKNVFDQIVHITEDGIEFWYARELQSALGYTRWENFVNAIEKAKVSCASSGRDVDGCFRDVTKTSPMPNGGTKDIADVMLIRYACYLIAQNGDPRKPEIAFAQAYFALQTRKQELLEQRISDLNRVQQRQQLRTSEKRLSQNIYERGVDDRGFARIRSKGDSALFGGRTTEEMKMQYLRLYPWQNRSDALHSAGHHLRRTVFGIRCSAILYYARYHCRLFRNGRYHYPLCWSQPGRYQKGYEGSEPAALAYPDFSDLKRMDCTDGIICH